MEVRIRTFKPTSAVRIFYEPESWEHIGKDGQDKPKAEASTRIRATKDMEVFPSAVLLHTKPEGHAAFATVEHREHEVRR